MQDEPAIFINYRRHDAAGHGRALHEYLSGRFGDDRVFFDRSTIESGDVFPDKLRWGVEGCAVLLALIGPEWLDIRGNDGSRVWTTRMISSAKKSRWHSSRARR
jgi:hypothetical protein